MTVREIAYMLFEGAAFLFVCAAFLATILLIGGAMS